jgi:hypothetical protein
MILCLVGLTRGRAPSVLSHFPPAKSYPRTVKRAYSYYSLLWRRLSVAYTNKIILLQCHQFMKPINRRLLSSSPSSSSRASNQSRLAVNVVVLFTSLFRRHTDILLMVYYDNVILKSLTRCARILSINRSLWRHS